MRVNTNFLGGVWFCTFDCGRSTKRAYLYVSYTCPFKTISRVRCSNSNSNRFFPSNETVSPYSRFASVEKFVFEESKSQANDKIFWKTKISDNLNFRKTQRELLEDNALFHSLFRIRFWWHCWEQFRNAFTLYSVSKSWNMEKEIGYSRLRSKLVRAFRLKSIEHESLISEISPEFLSELGFVVNMYAGTDHLSWVIARILCCEFQRSSVGGLRWWAQREPLKVSWNNEVETVDQQTVTIKSIKLSSTQKQFRNYEVLNSYFRHFSVRHDEDFNS